MSWVQEVNSCTRLRRRKHKLFLLSLWAMSFNLECRGQLRFWPIISQSADWPFIWLKPSFSSLPNSSTIKALIFKKSINFYLLQLLMIFISLPRNGFIFFLRIFMQGLLSLRNVYLFVYKTTGVLKVIQDKTKTLPKVQQFKQTTVFLRCWKIPSESSGFTLVAVGFVLGRENILGISVVSIFVLAHSRP